MYFLLDDVRTSKAPYSNFVLDFGYVLKVSDLSKFEEIHILCSLKDLAGSHGV